MSSYTVFLERRTVLNKLGFSRLSVLVDDVRDHLGDRTVQVGATESSWSAEVVVEGSNADEAVSKASRLVRNGAFAVGLPLWRLSRLEALRTGDLSVAEFTGGRFLHPSSHGWDDNDTSA
jgi:hypothetical protein